MINLYKLFVLSLFVLFTTMAQAESFKVSYDPDYAPFSYTLKDNQAHGLFIDIWKLWADKNGHSVTFVKAKDWNDALQLVKENKTDFFLGTDPYETWMQASSAYYKTKTALFMLKSFSTNPASIGIIGDDYRDDLKQKFPQAKIISYDTYSDLVAALIEQGVDAIYDDAIAITYFTIDHKINHLIQQTYRYSIVSDVCAISAKQKNITVFEKGFKKLSIGELEKIEKNWIFDDTLHFYNNICFLSKKNLLYVYDPDWKPFEYQDKATHTHMGIISDLIVLLSKKTGLSFTPVATESWKASVEAVKTGKADMFSAIPFSKENRGYLNFTSHDLYSYPAVLVSQKKTPVLSEKEIVQHTIGVVSGSTLGQWIQKRYPHAAVVQLENTEAGMQAVKQGDVDFFGINGVTAAYYINALGYDDLKIYKQLDHSFSLKVAISKQLDPDLLKVIDEGLTKITKDERAAVYRKWMHVKVRKETNWELVFIVSGILFGIIIIFVVLNKRLNFLVKQKTSELQQLNEALEQTVAERTRNLTEVNQKMQDNINYAALIQSALLPASKKMRRYLQDFFIIWHPKDTVGGDIYFFHEVSEGESLLFVIDCTGHGVSGAFVTMLAQAVKEQILAKYQSATDTPASILSSMNREFNQLLKQEDMHSDVGFDAAVVHIDLTGRALTFAGANIPLFYMDKGVVHTLKADRQSIGYQKNKLQQPYEDHRVVLQNDMKFYLSTDGFVDQNGGKHGYPMGKKRFKEILLSCYTKSFKEQKEYLVSALEAYRSGEEYNDDITLIGFEVRVD